MRMGKVIVPKTYVPELTSPLLFLAGPIENAPVWQDEAITYLLLENPEVVIASLRWEVSARIAPYLLSGDEHYFSRSRAWERHYLEIASKRGAIMFWLPQEETHSCQKSYGAMTRLELGQWITRYKFDQSVRFCIGSDGKFPELHTIQYDLQLDAPDKKIQPTLEETCREALRLATAKLIPP